MDLLAVVDALRPVGYPAPAAELAIQAGNAVAMVWQLLPGIPVRRLTTALLDQALVLNQLQADQLAGQPGIPAVRLYLASDGPGFCLHQPLRDHSTRSRVLERRITAIGSRYPDHLNGRDAVHYDYQPTNLLTHQGHVTGVVDWDGAGRGDRSLDLVTLRFGSHAIPADSDVTRRLDEILDALPPRVLTPLWAHMSLRMTDWAIRHSTRREVDRWLDLAGQRSL